MPLFKYEVADKNGKVMIGAMDAQTEMDVRQKLISRGYTVNLVIPDPHASAPKQPAAAPAGIRTMGTSAPAKEMAVFFNGLASYLKSGVSLHQALVQIGNQTPNQKMRQICNHLAARIQAGDRLSDAMLEFPKAFPPHVAGVVRAGELGGFLPIMVGDIALDYELARRSSSVWFKILCRIGWLHAIGLLLAAPILPFMFTKGVTDLVSGVRAYASWTSIHVALPIAVLILAYHIGAAILRQPSMRPTAHRLLLRASSFGQASKYRSLASFSRILWRLQGAGILPIKAWETASRAAENVVIADKLHQQSEGVRSGMRFSEALTATKLFSSEDQRILANGEATGQTSDTLQKIAAYYEDAALASNGRARFQLIRILIWANAFGSVAIAYSFVKYMQNLLEWVDWYFGTGTT